MYVELKIMEMSVFVKKLRKINEFNSGIGKWREREKIYI